MCGGGASYVSLVYAQIFTKEQEMVYWSAMSTPFMFLLYWWIADGFLVFSTSTVHAEHSMLTMSVALLRSPNKNHQVLTASKCHHLPYYWCATSSNWIRKVCPVSNSCASESRYGGFELKVHLCSIYQWMHGIPHVDKVLVSVILPEVAVGEWNGQGWLHLMSRQQCRAVCWEHIYYCCQPG